MQGKKRKEVLSNLPGYLLATLDGGVPAAAAGSKQADCCKTPNPSYSGIRNDGTYASLPHPMEFYVNSTKKTPKTQTLET